MEINVCPRWLTAKLGIAERQHPHFALLLSSVIVLASAPLLVRIPHICLMRSLLRVPCPGCGVLHGLGALEHLRLREAWQPNPASFVLAAFWLCQMVIRSIAMAWKNADRSVAALSWLGSRAVLACLFCVWTSRVL